MRRRRDEVAKELHFFCCKPESFFIHVPASKWPDGFLAKELVKLTDGIIGAPTAYLIAKNIGDRYGRAYIIDKVKFFEWFIGMDNIYVQAMKRDEGRR